MLGCFPHVTGQGKNAETRNDEDRKGGRVDHPLQDDAGRNRKQEEKPPARAGRRVADQSRVHRNGRTTDMCRILELGLSPARRDSGVGEDLRYGATRFLQGREQQVLRRECGT